MHCRNGPNFSDRHVLANTIDLDQFLKEQSAQGVLCLSFRLQLLDIYLIGKTTQFTFKDNYNIFVGFPNFKDFMVVPCFRQS